MPIELINQEDVAVDREHVRALAESMQNESNGSGNITGQLTPALLAEVPGEDKFVILDGFHRISALDSNGEEQVYSTVKLDCTPADVIDIRIVAAKSHKKVKFSRIVEWVEDAWAQTEWSDSINVSSAFIMTLLNSSGKGRVKKEDKLDDETVLQIKGWVQQKCHEWDISVNHVERYLRTAREADPALVKRAMERKSGHKLEDITPMHLTKITKHLPGEYTMQQVVASAAIANTLTIAQTDALSLAVSRADSYEAIDGYIDMKIWEKMGAASHAARKRRYSEIDPDNKAEYNQTLRDKFFDDQIELCEVLIENAVLLGRYDPKVEEATSTEINALIIRRGLQDAKSNGHLAPTNGKARIWEHHDLEKFAKEAIELDEWLVSSIKRKFQFGPEAAQDIAQEARIRFFNSLSEGKLSIVPEDKISIRKLLGKITERTAIDEIRKIRGREGQKPQEFSLDYELSENLTLEHTLGAEDENLTEVEGDMSDKEFIRTVLPFLNESQRRIVVLKGYFGLNSYETAKILLTTEGTINQGFRDIKNKVEKISQESQLSLANIA